MNSPKRPEDRSVTARLPHNPIIPHTESTPDRQKATKIGRKQVGRPSSTGRSQFIKDKLTGLRFRCGLAVWISCRLTVTAPPESKNGRGQEPGGSVWKLAPVDQEVITLQSFISVCGRSGLVPPSKCWPCSTTPPWDPTGHLIAPNSAFLCEGIQRTGVARVGK